MYKHKPSTKVFNSRTMLLWTIIVLGGTLVALLNSSSRVGFEQIILRSVCVLTMLVSLELRKIETSEGKPISLNLAIFFGCTGIVIFLAETDSIVLLSKDPFAGFYVTQYANAFYNSLMLFFVIFLVIQTVSASRSLLRKYLAASGLTAMISLGFYFPIIENPRYAYTVPAVQDFVSVENAQKELIRKGLLNPGAELIAGSISLSKWDGFRKTRELSYDESLKRVGEILPYTKGLNYMNLVHAPLRLIGLHMNLLAAFWVLVLMVINLVKDPPQGAYRDKFNLAVFSYLLFEIVHGHVFRGVIEWDTFLKIDGIGKIVTTLVILVILFVELQRYDFLSEAFGRYYESLLATNPLSVTRWRDGLDRLVLRHFFKNNRLSLRFLQKRL